MKNKIFTMLCWVFYGSLIYTAFNPEHAYLNALENAKTLYLFIHIPLLVFMSILSLLLVFSKKAYRKTIEDTTEDFKNKPDKFKKSTEETKKLHKFNLFRTINRLIYYPASFITFLILDDRLLGGTMLLCISISLILMDQLKALSKEITDAAI